MLEKLPMLSVKWRVKQEAGYSVCVMPTSVRERVWTDIEASSQEECIVQVELSRKLAGTRKVRMSEMLFLACLWTPSL